MVAPLVDSRPTWLCVDFQPYFLEPATASERLSLLASVTRDLRWAIACGCAIVFTEVPYISKLDEAPLQPTLPELTRLVPGGSYLRVEKFISGHSPFEAAGAVITACEAAGFGLDNIRICGVNTGGWLEYDHGKRTTDGCVFDMVVGLATRKKSHIDVVRSACAELRPGRTAKWADFRALPDVCVLEPGLEGWGD